MSRETFLKRCPRYLLSKGLPVMERITTTGCNHSVSLDEWAHTDSHTVFARRYSRQRLQQPRIESRQYITGRNYKHFHYPSI